MIAWTSFSWDAFSTLMTGTLAVGGAYLIGRRQLRIQRRQTDIQQKLAELQELTLRTDNFDRRYSVFDRTYNFIFAIVSKGAFPSDDILQSFIIAKGEAKFLFGAELLAGLNEIWLRSIDYRDLGTIMDPVRKQKLKQEAFAWFSECLGSLPVLFHEMNLAGRLA